MPKKFSGTNSKAAAANERKSAAKAEKDNQARKVKEDKEAKLWQIGAEKAGKKEDQQAKRLEKLARKAEADKLLEEENKGIAKSKPNRTGGPSKLAPKTKKPEPAVSASAARGAEKKAVAREQVQESAEAQNRPVQEFQARNIDDALLLLDAVNEDAVDESGKPAAAKKAAMIDRHPERRFKAAFEAYKDAHFDSTKAENPGLRKQQIEDQLFKQFKKAPENPFNQVHASHNATQDEIGKLVEGERQKLESRLQIK